MNLDMGVIKDFSVLLTAIAGISYWVSKYVLAQALNNISAKLNEKLDAAADKIASKLEATANKLIDEIREDRTRLCDHSERIGKVEESTKSAHKRIDELKGGLK